MSQIEFSMAARLDRRKITINAAEFSGVDFARRLQGSLKSTLSMLADYPLAGHTWKELDPPDHSFRYYSVMGRFIIVYQPVDKGIRVARILNGLQPLASELDNESGGRD
ncbi:MAG: type II toxin-antitoxin system RelE/ParE family toxin [Planctomycetes bacterium]|nr:type II toxin-antitoxin system RelE/ParE family toxin [Planctomycetota bacterium]